MRLTLFFTYGVSLKTWNDIGILKREVKLYQELHKRYGMQIQFLTYGDELDRNRYNDLDGIEIIPVYEKIKRYKSRVLTFIQSILIPFIFRKELINTDFIKTNQIWGSWVAVLTKWFLRKPLLVRCGFEEYKNNLSAGNTGFKSIFLKYISLLAYRHADHIWLNTKDISNFVQNRFLISSNHITIYPNWIDTDHFKPTQNASKIMNRVLFVGRFAEEKNIPFLFEALKNSDIGIDLIGDGELKPELIVLAKKLGLDAKFLGTFPNNIMPDLYNKYQLYIICSKYEGNPKTLLEAMACGLVVIGTDVSGIREIIINGKNGFLVEEDASSSLIEYIQTIFSDQSLCKASGMNARKTIMENNSLDVAINKEYSLYQQLSNN